MKKNRLITIILPMIFLIIPAIADESTDDLQVGFKGSTTVLNDGKKPNTLILVLRNNTTKDLTIIKATEMKLTFETDEKGLFGIGTKKQVGNYRIENIDNDYFWPSFDGQNSWTLRGSKNNIPFKKGEQFEFKIGNIITSCTNGSTRMDVKIKNISGLPNGFSTHLTIEKTPLITMGENVGIGTTAPAAKLDVNGVIKAQGFQGFNFKVLTAGGVNAGPVDLPKTHKKQWGNFPDLTLTFTLQEPTTIMAFYQVAQKGPCGFLRFRRYLFTRLIIDGEDRTRAIVGNTKYWGNSNCWFETLGKGEHTVKVQYRTPSKRKNDPGKIDYQIRVLQVLIFGPTQK